MSLEDRSQEAGLFADQVAAAVEADVWHKQKDDLRTAIQALKSVRSGKELYETFVDRAVRLLNATGGGLYKWNPPTSELDLVVDPLRPKLAGTKIGLGEGIAGNLILRETDEPVCIPDYRNSPQRAPVFREYCPFESVVEVIIRISKKNPWGVLYVDDKLGRVFTESDLSVLELYTSQAAFAIEMHERAEEARFLDERHRLVREMANALVSAPSLNEGCERLARKLLERFSATFCRIMLAQNSPPAVLAVALGKGTREKVRHELREDRLGSGAVVLHRLKTTGAPALVLDEAESLSLFPNSGLTDLNSTILVAVPSDGELLGTVELGFTNVPGAAVKEFCSELSIGLGPLFAALVDRFTNSRQSQTLWRGLEMCRQIRAGTGITHPDINLLRIAIDLSGARGALLRRYYPERQRLEFVGGEGLIHKHDLAVTGTIAGHAATSASIQEGRRGLGDEEGIPNWVSTVVCVPLIFEGNVTHVLSLWFELSSPALDDNVRRLLQYFADFGADALYNAQLRSEETLRKSGMWGVISLLSSFLLEARLENKTLDAALTAITAGYGLAFNRAAVFLMNETSTELIGAAGIGQLERQKAEAAWHLPAHRTFDRYLKWLAENPPAETDLGRAIHLLTVPVSPAGENAFSRAAFGDDTWIVENPTEQGSGLDPDFVKAFQPTGPLMMTPIRTSRRSIGLLVADKRFTPSPVTPDEKEFLASIANIMALALTRLGEDWGGFAGMPALYKLTEPDDILNTAINAIRNREGARGATIFLIDQGDLLRTVSSGDDRLVDFLSMWKRDGLTMKIMEYRQALTTGPLEVLADFPNMASVYTPVRSMGLPCVVDSPLGVVWLHWDREVQFDEARIARLVSEIDHVGLAWRTSVHSLAERALAEVTDRLVLLSGPLDVAQQITELARSIFGADLATVWTYDPAKDEFDPAPAGFSGLDRKEAPPRPEFGRTTYRILVQKNYQSGLLSEVEAIFPPAGDSEPWYHRFKLKCFQGIALRVGEERLGVLYLAYRTNRVFTGRDEEQVCRFAAIASVSLSRARLAEQARANQTEALKRIAEIVSVPSDREGFTPAMDVIANEVQTILGANSVTLYSYEPDRGDFNWPPGISRGVMAPSMILAADRVRSTSMVRQLVGRVEPYLIPDTSENDLLRERRFTRDEGVASCAILPLILPGVGKNVGLLFVNYSARGEFSDVILAKMKNVASQAAIACRHAQILETTRSVSEHQKALVALAQRLLDAATLRDALDLALQTTGSGLSVEFSGIVLPKGDGLIFVQGIGWNKGLEGNYFPEPGAGSHAGYTISERHPVVVDDFQKEKRFEVPPVIFENGICSGVAVPMKFESEVVGAMLAHTARFRHFTDAEVLFLSTVASQVAISIRLLEQYEAIQGVISAIGKLTRGVDPRGGSQEVELPSHAMLRSPKGGE